jgi:hypothetical protein
VGNVWAAWARGPTNGDRGFRSALFLRCNGGRHPGFRDDVALRGAAFERKPRSVRRARCGSPPAVERRADDSGCPEGAEEGNVVSQRHKALATAIDGQTIFGRGRVLRSVLRPVHVLLTATSRAKARMVRRSRRHRGRASLRKQEEPAPGSSGADDARLAARHRPAREPRGATEKEGGHGLRPCEDRRARVR